MTNVTIVLPTPGGDTNAWGPKNNTALAALRDAVLASADAVHGNHFVVSATEPVGVPDGTVWIQA